MRVLLLLTIPIFLISCSYEKRLSRAKRKLGNLVAEFPALAKHDTIFRIDTIRIEAKAIKGDIELNRKYEKLDSLFNAFIHDTTKGKETTINTIKEYIINKPMLADTFRVDTMGIHFRLFEVKGNLKYWIDIDEEQLIKKYATVVNSVNPVQTITEATWFDRWLIRPFAVIALIFIILDLIASRREKN